jgi:hypothetical protein
MLNIRYYNYNSYKTQKTLDFNPFLLKFVELGLPFFISFMPQFQLNPDKQNNIKN